MASKKISKFFRLFPDDAFQFFEQDCDFFRKWLIFGNFFPKIFVMLATMFELKKIWEKFQFFRFFQMMLSNFSKKIAIFSEND